MKKKNLLAGLLAGVMCAGILTGCGGGKSTAESNAPAEEGKVINIYSWNDEFHQRVEAVYDRVTSTSSDGTITYLDDGTEIHWIINPNTEGVYQNKLDEALLQQANAAAIAEKTGDWETLKQTAQDLKDKGYYTFSSYADTFRLYGNSISESWVQAGSSTLKVDQQILNWVNNSKEWLDAGYLEEHQGPVERRLEQGHGLSGQGVRLPAACMGH